MPGSHVYPQSGYKLSDAELRKRLGKGNPLYEYLQHFAKRDKVYNAWDFLGDTIDLNDWALANSGGAGAANFAVQVLENGAVRSATGTTDNGSISMISPAIYYGDRNCGVHFRFKYDVVTGLNFEVGFAAAVPAANAGTVSDIDTPAVADDSAVLTMDTDQTLTTMAFATGGTAFTDTKTNCASTTVPTAATYMDVRIQLVGNSAYCWVNGVLEASHAGDYVEGGTPLAIWVYSRTRDTTTKLLDLDLVEVWSDRNV